MLSVQPAQFWFVWTKTGHVPRFAHDTLEAATVEAQRLAQLRSGKTFIVLQAVSKWRAEPEFIAAEAEEAA